MAEPTPEALIFARNTLADDPEELDEDWLAGLLDRFAAQRREKAIRALRELANFDMVNSQAFAQDALAALEGAPPHTGTEDTERSGELSFWRKDAFARLQIALWRHAGVERKGDEDRAAQIRVEVIYPTLAALTEADALSWASPEDAAVLDEARGLQSRGDDSLLEPPML